MLVWVAPRNDALASHRTVTIVAGRLHRLDLQKLLRRITISGMRDMTIDAVCRIRINRLPARQENVKVIVECLIRHGGLMTLDARVVTQFAQRYRRRMILAAVVRHQVNRTLSQT